MFAIIRPLTAGGTLASSDRQCPGDELARVRADVQATDGNAR
jgi:hypothetical protein